MGRNLGSPQKLSKLKRFSSRSRYRPGKSRIGPAIRQHEWLGFPAGDFDDGNLERKLSPGTGARSDSGSAVTSFSARCSAR